VSKRAAERSGVCLAGAGADLVGSDPLKPSFLSPVDNVFLRKELVIVATDSDKADLFTALWPLFSAKDAVEYWVDTWQRSILLLDVLRQRGNNYIEQNAQTVPNVLNFGAELVVDGRSLPRPVNYGLVRIVPPEGVATDPNKRPFIVFDPRAGHGPGIGGMKHDSEIGVALKAGHPCYFVGFLPAPMPGQTIEDVCEAEARFVEEVVAHHPEADGKPCLIGNCQAGWQIMMMAAVRPDLAGPIMLAGSPLSYWDGVRGESPMRYLGGLFGGTWLTSLAGDLGNGIFDGANLVANFEAMHPDNTYWTKLYNVYSKVDTEALRFLEFEKWWGSPVLLNAREMQSIADNLFVGNKLSCGGLQSRTGMRIDLRNVTSPIIVFCSRGDDITPPPQALDWILDLYADYKDIVAAGQTIVYCLHQSIGHLGIFVSGKVATKEHKEFAMAMDMIDLMPPGLYEALITGVDESIENPELAQGEYLMTLERRGLDDIRALGTNSPADDRAFATVARLSEINQGLYRTLLGPAVSAVANEPVAEFCRQMHPNRARFRMFADKNPLMAPVKAWAEWVRENRRPVAADNPLLGFEHTLSAAVAETLKVWGKARDELVEKVFFATYDQPWLQAMVGLGADNVSTRHRIERDLSREAAAAQAAAHLEQRIAEGGLIEAAIRALIYIRLPEGSIDERGFAAIKDIGAELPPGERIGYGRFKEAVKEQFLIVLLQEERAVEALPIMLHGDRRRGEEVLAMLHRVLAARGALSPEAARRLARIEQVLDLPVPITAARPDQQTAAE
jgi:pimeloyl-ACP methyl ester carboxylesterase